MSRKYIYFFTISSTLFDWLAGKGGKVNANDNDTGKKMEMSQSRLSENSVKWKNQQTKIMPVRAFYTLSEGILYSEGNLYSGARKY